MWSINSSVNESHGLFLVSALSGLASESWSMFIIKTSPCALTVPTKCAALNCTTTISTCLRVTEDSSHALRSSAQTLWHRQPQRLCRQDGGFHHRTGCLGARGLLCCALEAEADSWKVLKKEEEAGSLKVFPNSANRVVKAQHVCTSGVE